MGQRDWGLVGTWRILTRPSMLPPYTVEPSLDAVTDVKFLLCPFTNGRQHVVGGEGGERGGAGGEGDVLVMR